MGYRRLGFVSGSYCDTNTGEQLEGIPVLARTKPKTLGSWARIDLNELQALALDPEMRRIDWQVLSSLIAHAEMENVIRVSQMDLARQLNSYSSNISRSINKLVNKGILERYEKIGNVWTYKLNHNLVWRGNFAKLRKLQDEEAEQEEHQETKTA